MDMDFDDPEDHDDMPLSPSSDTFSNPSRLHTAPPPPVCGAETVAAPQQLKKPRYRECLKNHALGLGGHTVDGCGEFMPAGTEGTLDALKCAACNCHRNFHRKEANCAGDMFVHSHHLRPQIQPQFSPYNRTPAGYLHVALPPQRPLALPSTSGGGGTYNREDQDDASDPSGGGRMGSKKRHRTKFTAEQKEKMLELAEKLGWRIQKHDEEVVQQFCEETGLKRNVLKVWMHNNKHTLGKKP